MSVSELASFEQERDEVARAEPYPELRPLPPQRPEAPELPAALLPPTLRPWLEDISERMQVALELAAVPALVSLSGVVGRKIGIHPKALDDWLVVPNLWGGIVARPGKMKSPTLAESLRPLRNLASVAQQLHQESSDATGAHLDSLKAKEAAIKDQLKQAHKGKGNQSAVDLEGDLTEVRCRIREHEQASSARRYVVNDSTTEKLGELLKANPWGLVLERDELAGWLRGLERDDRRGDRELFLEAWNGTNPYTYDRIGRGTIVIPALCLSIVGGIQPTKLSRFVSEALAGGYAADGLLQRFQLLVWPEDRRGWTLVDRIPNIAAREKVFAVFQRLSEMEGPGEGEAVPAVHFAPDAQALFFEWLSCLELRLRSNEIGEEAPAFESHLSKYRSLMPSLALLFHLVETSDPEISVSLAAAQRAADWCGFLEQHARKVYAAELKSNHMAAHAMARKVRDGSIVSGMTLREVYNAGWSELKSADSVSRALEVLTEYGWARVELRQTGGRPTRLVSVNPEVLRRSS